MDYDFSTMSNEQLRKLKKAAEQLGKRKRAINRNQAHKIRLLASEITMFVDADKNSDVMRNPIASELYK